MDFIIRLPISTNLKVEAYNSILVIINQLIIMVYYMLIKVIINTLGLAEIIIKVVV